MALAPMLIKAMQAIDVDHVYWSREGGSPLYRKYMNEVKELIRLGYVQAMPQDCCRKDYLLTSRGEAELKKLTQS